MTSPLHLKNFRDEVSSNASVVAAAALTGAANSMQQLSTVSNVAITAAARQHRKLKLAEQRQMSQGSLAVQVQVPATNRRGGKNTKKHCCACKLHKSLQTGHTATGPLSFRFPPIYTSDTRVTPVSTPSHSAFHPRWATRCTQNVHVTRYSSVAILWVLHTQSTRRSFLRALEVPYMSMIYDIRQSGTS